MIGIIDYEVTSEAMTRDPDAVSRVMQAAWLHAKKAGAEGLVFPACPPPKWSPLRDAAVGHITFWRRE